MSNGEGNANGGLHDDIQDARTTHRFSVKDSQYSLKVNSQDQVDGPQKVHVAATISNYYNMSHERRGQFIVINNETFDPDTELEKRKGTNNDARKLGKAFSELGFEVHRYDNLTTENMLKVLQKASKEDHSDADCFGCAILSHGSEGVVYGTDGSILIDTLLDEVKGDNNVTLAHKPKLFFIQACRGNELDDGVDVPDSATVEKEPTYRIPVEANFLTCYSVVPGHFSWRKDYFGSCYVDALATVLMEDGQKNEIMAMMTRVNRLVAYEFESNCKRYEKFDKKKQVPCIVSTLTKELYFKSKPQTHPSHGNIICHDKDIPAE